MIIKYIYRRVFYGLAAFLISVSITFILLHLMPGNYLEYILPYLTELNPEASRLFEQQFGLDKPLLVQYFTYLNNILYGSWGYSIQSGKPVWQVISEKLNWTLVILLPATLLSIAIGIAAGAYLGWKNGSKKDLLILNLMIIIRSIPSYWWAITFTLIFSYYLQLFTLGGFTSINALDYGINYLDVIHHSILPVVTLTLCSIPGHYY